MRELVYVIDTAPGQVTALAGQAIDAVVAVKDLLDTAHAHGTAPDAEAIAAQQQLLHSALVLARTATKAHATKLERKYHALTSLDAQRGITPAFGYGPRLGPVRLDFHQLPPTGLSTLGFGPTRFQTKPPACYRASWQLPGPDSTPASDDELTNQPSTAHTINLQSFWTHRPQLNACARVSGTHRPPTPT